MYCTVLTMRTYKIFDCPYCEEKEVEKYAKNRCKKCYANNSYDKRKADPEFKQMKKVWSRTDYLKNKEGLLLKQKNLRELNPGFYRKRCSDSMKKRRSRLKENGLFDDRYSFGGNRLKALQRDGFKCLECGLTMDESKESYNMSLVVHHIDGLGFNIKKVEDKNNNLDNLATLCVACHNKTHKKK